MCRGIVGQPASAIKIRLVEERKAPWRQWFKADPSVRRSEGLGSPGRTSATGAENPAGRIDVQTGAR